MNAPEAVPSVVLLSGGLDSAANLAFCVERDRVALALTANYGQRAADREIEAARALCSHYDVRHEVVDLRWLGSLGGSALTDSARVVPSLNADQLDDLAAAEKTAASVWVPNRNGVLINVAAAHAERDGARRVVVGFNIEEAATFPDNSQEFLARSSRTLEMSTRNHVEVFCYTTALNKREIVAELRKSSRAFPFDKVWSCYQGGTQPCGRCESCQRMTRAMQ